MDKKNYNYFKIDVPGGKYGYSFLVATRFPETEETIIDVARACCAFQYDEDADYATAERVEYGDYDYKGLEDTLVFLDAE